MVPVVAPGERSIPGVAQPAGSLAHSEREPEGERRLEACGTRGKTCLEIYIKT